MVSALLHCQTYLAVACFQVMFEEVVLKVFLQGIAGTAVMTAALYLISYFTSDRFKVVKILGTMLTLQTTPEKGLSDKPSAITVGLIAHYLVGIGFAAIYEQLWSQEITAPTFVNTTLLGFINGIVGAIVWKIFISVHPNPPRIPLRSYLVAIILGHVFFAYGILITYLMVHNYLCIGSPITWLLYFPEP